MKVKCVSTLFVQCKMVAFDMLVFMCSTKHSKDKWSLWCKCMYSEEQRRKSKHVRSPYFVSFVCICIISSFVVIYRLFYPILSICSILFFFFFLLFFSHLKSKASILFSLCRRLVYFDIFKMCSPKSTWNEKRSACMWIFC